MSCCRRSTFSAICSAHERVRSAMRLRATPEGRHRIVDCAHRPGCQSGNYCGKPGAEGANHRAIQPNQNPIIKTCSAGILSDRAEEEAESRQGYFEACALFRSREGMKRHAKHPEDVGAGSEGDGKSLITLARAKRHWTRAAHRSPTTSSRSLPGRSTPYSRPPYAPPPHLRASRGRNRRASSADSRRRGAVCRGRSRPVLPSLPGRRGSRVHHGRGC